VNQSSNNLNYCINQMSALSLSTTMSSTRQLSTPATATNSTKLVIPPNLKIDPRAFSSPFYGLEKVTSKDNQNNNNDDDGDDDETIITKNTSKEEKDDNFTYYDLTSKPDPIYAIPLPQRLTVSIYDIPSSSSSSSSNNNSNIVGTITLSPHLFGQDPIRIDILHRCIIHQRNIKRGLRNNGARTKTKSQISGSGRKVRQQKGSGKARAGHSRPAHWRGGAKAHGPKGSMTNYETKLNKKVKRLGLKMALSQKLKEGNLILVNDFSRLETYKTSVLAKVLEGLGGGIGKMGSTAYVIDHVEDNNNNNGDDDTVEGSGEITSVNGVHVNLQVASRNLFKIKVTNQRNLNVYDILKYNKLVLSLSALEALESRTREI
jgi:large subunit ribosomal protein L4